MAAEAQQNQQPSFVAGLTLTDQTDDAANLLQFARADGYDFVTTSLPPCPPSDPAAVPLPRKDVTSLESKWWSTSVVGAVMDPAGFVAPPLSGGGNGEGGDSMVIDKGGDSEEGKMKENHGLNLIAALSDPNSALASEAERHINFMVEWAGHMSIPAVILPPVPTDPTRAVHYARLLSTVALQCSSTNVQLWVRTCATRQSLEAFELLHRRADGPSNLGCLVCFDSSSPAHVAGSIPGGLSAQNVGLSMTLIHQFVGCNLRAVSFSTTVFLTNKRGYPTLSKSHQVLFTELLRRLGRTLRVLVEGAPLHHIPLPSGAPGHNVEATGQTGCLAYLQYLRHLRTRSEVTDVLDTEESSMEASYLDHLQSPLQPLGDNLEFQTYETFEKDPVKYAQYGIAIQLAVRDGIAQGKLVKVNNDAGDSGVFVNILVVGAGRGPLVRAAIDAVEVLNSTLAKNPHTPPCTIVPRIVAVEKNASAVLYLRSLQSREARWRDTVTVVECDMRYADSHPVLRRIIADEGSKADLVVSELLGSFGDNELSPECLDGVQQCGLLKPHCVSIPQRYTSYVAPVSSMRLHSEAEAQAYSPSSATDGPMGKPCGTLQAMETPYVVRSHAACQTHVELSCWEFVHPKPDVGASNDRTVHLVFGPDVTHGAGCGPGYGAFDPAVSSMSTTATAAEGAAAAAKKPSGITVHGFLGTFHSTLYESPAQPGGEEGQQQQEKEAAVISIAPSTFSVGMFSWFPIYFPLREPLHIPDGSSLGFTMWRRSDGGGSSSSSSDRGAGGRVWYEWCAEVSDDVSEDDGGQGGSRKRVLSSSPVHNPNGRSYHVRL